MQWLYDYILTWRLPVSLLFVGLSILPIREAYRNLRISATQFGRNFTEQMFLSTLLLTIAGGVYPYMLCLLPVPLYLFYRRHILDARSVWAWILAIAIFAIYYLVFKYWIQAG